MKIAIDGPAGAGKSTIAKALAATLGFQYIDTGAMYRAIALKALQFKVDLDDQQALLSLAVSTHIIFQPDTHQQKVICDGQDVTEAIRSPEVSAVVSRVASSPVLRKYMVKWQQEMAASHAVVMDGRDIGECVLPDANFKFFITASLEERTQRRIKELQAKGYEVDQDEIQEDINARDRSDANREMGALKVLPDSIVVDTSSLTIEQVLAQILSVIREA